MVKKTKQKPRTKVSGGLAVKTCRSWNLTESKEITFSCSSWSIHFCLLFWQWHWTWACWWYLNRGNVLGITEMLTDGVLFRLLLLLLLLSSAFAAL